MQLKTYQKETLTALRAFFEAARISGPAAAYEAAVADGERRKRLGDWASGYRAPDGMADMPYVCVRIPTGGGKTLLAAHAIDIVRKAWMEREYPVALWLTPSDMIRQQTVDALKNRRHFYRQALDEAFGGRVRVFDIADFALIRPPDLRDNCCIVVATTQALRHAKTDRLKVYAHHEDLEPHFAQLPLTAPGLERLGNSGVKFSFANLMHVLRPLLIVDEAHNNTTPLSYETYARLNPCAAIEFTATPRFNSNLLYSVTGWELKQAQMVKLPIRISESRNDWRVAVAAACDELRRLAALAQKDREYIRPIALFQAQSKDGEVTVDILRDHLVEREGVAPERIAVATGSQRDLEGVDLFDKACPVDHVITMQALREGWDCSFAYVLCSVAGARSEVSIEQLLGRVLRMPYVTRRDHADLNMAYAHVSQQSFREAADKIVQGLIAMGFDKDEARDHLDSAQYEPGDDDLFTARRPPPAFVLTAPAESVAALRAIADPRVSLAERDGAFLLRNEGFFAPETAAQIEAALPQAQRAGFREQAAAYVAQTHPLLAPAQRGETFIAPALMAHVQGELVFASDEEFLEAFDWSPATADARLEASRYSPSQSRQLTLVDVSAAGLQRSVLSDLDELVLSAPLDTFARANFATWVESELREMSYRTADLRAYVLKALAHLIDERELPVAALWHDRYRLTGALRALLADQKRKAREAAHQFFLFSPEATPTVSRSEGFRFHERMFDGVRTQRGRPLRFQKHFLGPDRVPAFDGRPDGEEVQCAVQLDRLPQVKHWVRNVQQHPDAFYLPLATTSFYPDFIAELTDGRIFVVEYKGEGYVKSDDSREKRAIGKLWERVGGGLFLMVEKQKHGLNMLDQLKTKLNAST